MPYSSARISRAFLLSQSGVKVRRLCFGKTPGKCKFFTTPDGHLFAHWAGACLFQQEMDMTKHFTNQINSAGQEMHVEIGFDGILSEFFLNIKHGDNFIYTSLADATPDKDSLWLTTMTAKHGLVIPHSMMADLAFDAMFGGGNSITEHADHVQSESEKLMLQLGFRQEMPSSLPVDDYSVWAWFSKEGVELGDYSIAMSKQYAAYMPAKLCDLIPNEAGVWKKLDEASFLEKLEQAKAKLLLGAFSEPGESMEDVVQRVVYFRPLGNMSESKLSVIFSEQAFGIDGKGFWNGDDLWVSAQEAHLYKEPIQLPKDGSFISASTASAINRGEMFKCIEQRSERLISDDDECATCSNCHLLTGGMSSCSRHWPGYIDKDGYVQHCFEKATQA